MQNLLKIDIKVILIVILVGVLLFRECTNHGNNNSPQKTVKIDGKKYNVISDKTDTIKLPPIITIKHEKGNDIPYPKIIYVKDTSKKPIDTLGVVKDYLAKREYTDTLKLKDTGGYVIVNDTVSKNRLIGRSWDAVITKKLFKETIIVTPPPVTQVYFGFTGTLTKTDVVNSIGAGFLLKTKTDKIYQLGIGLSHQSNNTNLVPFLGVGAYWKIKSHK